jgi:hypothetical protein
VVALLALVAVASPALLALGWVAGGVQAPLSRDSADVLPAYVVASSAVPSRPRALVLKAHPDGVTTYALVPGLGRQLGDADVAPRASLSSGVRDAVSLVLSGRGGVDQIAQLGLAGIGYLVVDAPVDASLERTLDGVPGLLRVSSIDSGAVWRLLPPGARVQLLRPGVAPLAIPADPLSRTTAVDADLPAAVSGGAELLLTEAAARGWRATADGTALQGRVLEGWAQGFALPAGATHVTVRYVSSRPGWLTLQGVLVLAVVVLALPTRRRRGLGRDGDDADADDADDTDDADAGDDGDGDDGDATAQSEPAARADEATS